MAQFVYFIGAGLSKALELPSSPAKRIPLMGDFVSVMGDYISDPVVQASVASFVKEKVFASPPKLLKEFAEMKLQSKSIDCTMRRDVARLLTKLPEQNIELLLSSAPALRNRVAFGVNAIFRRIGWNVEFNCLDHFLRKQFAIRGAKHTFVSFNYDLLLDRSIQKIAPSFNLTWRPEDGYGFAASGNADPKGKVTLSQPRTQGDFAEYLRKSADPLLTRSSDVKILKPHGSLNWLVPFTGNYKFDDKAPAVSQDAEQVCYVGDFDHLQTPPSGDETGYWGIFIIPPEQNKDSSASFIRQLLSQEEEAIRDADEIYVIGWSAPRTDGNQLGLIGDAVRRRSSRPMSLIAINYRAPCSYFDMMEDSFAVNRTGITRFNEGFCEFVAGADIDF
jgi:hypothetical protein